MMEEPVFTDIHQLRRAEEKYYRRFQIMQKWRPQPTQYADMNATTTEFCSIYTDRSDEFGDHSKDVLIASSIRGAWAFHIVEIHNQWLAVQKTDE